MTVFLFRNLLHSVRFDLGVKRAETQIQTHTG
jgi:hypothetical protein